uniref:Uncharacterized protein n=1 Tax=Octopus bimaculoides TaxID=37653 RepID=A0A0L8I7P9_OCTBM
MHLPHCLNFENFIETCRWRHTYKIMYTLHDEGFSMLKSLSSLYRTT